MASPYFMEDLILRDFNAAVFQAHRPRRASERVSALLDAYGELLRRRDPAEFERLNRVPDSVLREMGALGLFGVNIPERYGGKGLSLTEYLVFIEEAVKFDLSTALVFMSHSSLGVNVLLNFGTEEQKRRYLVPAASGDLIFGFGLTEPLHGSDPRNLETRAEETDGGTHYLLNGTKTYVTNANYARAFTVFARMDASRPGFLGVFVVERDTPGLRVSADMPKMGLRASSTASLHFKDVRVPRGNRVGQAGQGFKIAMTTLNYGRLKLGAASVGLLDLSLRDMTRRASTRIQFGRPIREYPLVQEKLVAARLRSFTASAMNDFTAQLLERTPLLDAAVETSHCKLYGTTQAWETLYDALQVAGGAGYLTTLPYEKRLRDFRVATLFEGTTEIHSLYPFLFLLGKALRAPDIGNRGKIARAAVLLRNAFRPLRGVPKFEDPLMDRGAAQIRANTRALRRLFFLGPLLYGPRVRDRQFFLRRFTRLSMATFGLAAVLARMAAEQNSGVFRREDRDLLKYYLEEVRQVRRECRNLLPTRREALHRAVIRRLLEP